MQLQPTTMRLPLRAAIPLPYTGDFGKFVQASLLGYIGGWYLRPHGSIPHHSEQWESRSNLIRLLACHVVSPIQMILETPARVSLAVLKQTIIRSAFLHTLR